MSIAIASSRSALTSRTTRRVIVVGAAATAALLLFAAPAFAHITISPDSVPGGSTTELTFHVPDEEANASTVKVDVQIPTVHPIAQLLAKPVPGWTVLVKTIRLPKPVTTDDGTFTTAVSEVIWSGGHVEPGQFQDFSISCDSLPAGPGQLVFKAIQTYSNGDIVRWIDLSQPGQPAAAHPAPAITLTAATVPVGTGTSARTSNVTASPAADSLARGLGIGGVLIGLLACLLALTLVRRDRRLTAELVARAGTPASNGAAAATAAPRPDQGSQAAKAPVRRDQVPARTKTSAKRPQSRRSH